MVRTGWSAALAGAVLVAASAAAAEDSCLMALNTICEEPHLGPGYCAPATDSTDCADAFVIPDSDTRRLDGDALRHFLPDTLRLARNEIYARHGYRFNSADLQAFFGARAWYRSAGRDVTLSAVEQANVTLLRRIEEGALDPADQTQRSPDGMALPPLAAWQADVVHADGTREAAIVDGVRARVTEPGSGRTVLVRVDREDALYFDRDDEERYGTAVWWGLFPPVLLEPFVHGLGIVPEPLERGMVAGQKATHVRLAWESEGGYETLHGEAWLTDDGIFVKVDVEGVFAECCGGDENVPWRLNYRLENLERGRPDPVLLEPPPNYEWGYAG